MYNKNRRKNSLKFSYTSKTGGKLRSYIHMYIVVKKKVIRGRHEQKVNDNCGIFNFLYNEIIIHLGVCIILYSIVFFFLLSNFIKISSQVEKLTTVYKYSWIHDTRIVLCSIFLIFGLSNISNFYLTTRVFLRILYRCIHEVNVFKLSCSYAKLIYFIKFDILIH